MNSNWILYNKKKNIQYISQKFGINPLTSVILCNRDINSDDAIKKILSDDLNDLNDPKLLPDVDIAIKIINEHINEKKHIRIVGDYDIDGVCATYILYDAFKRVGANISYYIPDRFLDGYGISKSIIDKALQDKVDLILTCDNGIAANDVITYASENGIKVIVTDHHDIGELPKDALAIVNPKRKDTKNLYPFENISGAVVAYKLIIRYFDEYVKNSDNVLYDYLDFAMISTIGDIMPLLNENHIITKVGLNNISCTKNKGLKKLFDVSGLNLDENKITAYHIGFVIGPLINAAGRMGNAEDALKLFLSDDEEEINSISYKLKELNDERKSMTDKGVIDAIKIIEDKYINDSVFVIFVEGLGEQVAGIVAGRIKDKYNKPTIILTDTINENEAKASCRSIDQYDIFNSLNVHKDMFLKFGGHMLAAGFSILKKDVELLRIKLNEECKLTENDFVKRIYIDAVFPFYEVSEDVILDMGKLEPFGQGFNKPLFATKDTTAKILNVYGNEQNVVKLLLEKDNKKKYGVAFTEAKKIEEMLINKETIDITYYPKINTFRDIRSVEINVVNYR